MPIYIPHMQNGAEYSRNEGRESQLFLGFELKKKGERGLPLDLDLGSILRTLESFGINILWSSPFFFQVFCPQGIT